MKIDIDPFRLMISKGEGDNVFITFVILSICFYTRNGKGFDRSLLEIVYYKNLDLNILFFFRFRNYKWFIKSY